ncbi:MAG: thiamine pyrophosphate-binding protein [Candidatus Hodarchaeota archaeon]
MAKNDANEEKMHGGDVLVRALHAEGIEYVFGLPGGEFLPFLEALDRWGTKNGMKYIGVRHEQAAGHMADGYARASGKVGVCCGTVGPGVTDLVPGIDSAYADNIPLLVIHPQMEPKFENHHRLQGDLDQLTLLRPLVKYQKHIADPNRIVWAAQKCFKELHSGRPNPVQLEVREDAFYGNVEDYGQVILKPHQYRNMEPPAGNPVLIEKACDLLLKAEKPLIVSGGGIASADAFDPLQELSVKYNIPVATTIMGIGTISTNKETYIGTALLISPVNRAAREADVVLALGTKFSYTLGYGKAPLWNPDGKVIQVDIDPQMIGKNKPVDIGILGDCRVVLEQLLETLGTRGAGKIGSKDWLPALKEERRLEIDTARPKLNSTKTPIHPLRVIGDLTSFINPEDILVADGGDIQVLTSTHVDFTKHREPRTFISSIGMGHLGAGIPYAIGAKLAKPDSRVFMITGDGSFLFNVQELDTAMKYGIPFVCVIADNCKWGMIANAEKRNFKKRQPFCVDICSNYVKIAQGFGCYAERVDNAEDIKPALQRAVDSGIPAVIQIPTKSVAPAGSKLIISLKKLRF